MQLAHMLDIKLRRRKQIETAVVWSENGVAILVHPKDGAGSFVSHLDQKVVKRSWPPLRWYNRDDPMKVILRVRRTETDPLAHYLRTP